MYSVINVDISANSTDFLTRSVYYSQSDIRYVDYCQKAVIRGSSTVNGDSAHSNGNLEQEHNYVSFYVKNIQIRYDISSYFYSNVTFGVTYPFYVILFKFPYKDDEDIRNKLISNRLVDMVLYSHPECVLSYDFVSVEVDKVEKLNGSGFLKCSKPFVVGPNDYVGVFYYCPHYSNIDKLISRNVATAKVTFKPQ